MACKHLKQLNQFRQIEHQPSGGLVPCEFLSLLEQLGICRGKRKQSIHGQPAQRAPPPAPLPLEANHYLAAFERRRERHRQNHENFQSLPLGTPPQARSRFGFRLNNRAHSPQARRQARCRVAPPGGGF
jgi:hypothetical protein